MVRKGLNLSINNNTHNEEYISLLQFEINGGKATKGDIDLISNYPKIREIKISGLQQDTFEYFISKYANQFKRIYFWKCPKIESFESLKYLIDIESLSFYWNQKTTNLWDMSKNIKLKSVDITDFIHLTHLNDLQNENTIEHFSVGIGFNGKAYLDSVKPFESCKKLKTLNFSINKLLDNDIKPLIRIESLEELDFPTNLFTTEQVAWLKAHLSEKVKSKTINSVKLIESPFEIDSKIIDTIIVGKGKPMLSSFVDQKRIEKYKGEFDALVTKFKLEV